MIPGLNTEVTRRGRVVHIQTEVHGQPRYELVTHVFVGGEVIHTVRHVIEQPIDRVQADDISRSMRQQHRTVHQSVSDGLFDGRLLVRGRNSQSGIPLATRDQRPTNGRED